jgi:hypothetical protein
MPGGAAVLVSIVEQRQRWAAAARASRATVPRLIQDVFPHPQPGWPGAGRRVAWSRPNVIAHERLQAPTQPLLPSGCGLAAGYARLVRRTGAAPRPWALSPSTTASSMVDATRTVAHMQAGLGRQPLLAAFGILPKTHGQPLALARTLRRAACRTGLRQPALPGRASRLQAQEGRTRVCARRFRCACRPSSAGGTTGLASPWTPFTPRGSMGWKPSSRRSTTPPKPVRKERGLNVNLAIIQEVHHPPTKTTCKNVAAIPPHPGQGREPETGRPWPTSSPTRSTWALPSMSVASTNS